MKCAISCLLAFSAFQTVFAVDVAQNGLNGNIVNQETISKMTEANKKIEKPFWDAATAVKLTGKGNEQGYPVSAFDCFMAADVNDFHIKYSAAAATCDRFYNKAKITKQIKMKLADKRCDKATAKFQRLAKSNYDKAVACVAECVKLQDRCTKMLENLRIQL